MPFNSTSPSGPVEFQPKTTSDGGPCNRFWANGWNSFLNQKLAVSHTFTSNSILLTQSEFIFDFKCLIVLSDSIYNDYSRARNKEVIQLFQTLAPAWYIDGLLQHAFCSLRFSEKTPLFADAFWRFIKRESESSLVGLNIWFGGQFPRFPANFRR